MLKKKMFYILTETFSGEKEKGIFTDQTETGALRPISFACLIGGQDI